MTRWAAGLWWGSHWRAPPFVKNSEVAAAGLSPVGGPRELGAAAVGAQIAKRAAKREEALLMLNGRRGRPFQKEVH